MIISRFMLSGCANLQQLLSGAQIRKISNNSIPPLTGKIWLALGALYLIWGSTYLAIRFTVETIPPFISAAARFIISGALLMFFRWFAGDAMPTSVQWRNAAIIGIFLLVCGNGGVVWAAQFIPSSLSALLVATVPLWMVLLDAIRPEGSSPEVRPLCGILLGFTGALLLIGLTRDRASAENFYGRSSCWRHLCSGP
jgi:drug/metabolite transporter (DMT)-like permease